MKVRCTSIAAAALLCAAAQAAESRFDAGTEGWTAADIRSSAGGGALTWETDGRVSTADQFDWNVFSAPAAFTGDLRAYIGGTLSFELQTSSLDSGADGYFGAALVTTKGDRLVWYGGAPSTTSPTSFVATLDAAHWEFNPSSLALPGTGTHVTDEKFDNMLEFIAAVYIDADWNTGVDLVYLDNVVLAAVPEPGTLVLALTGVAALLGPRLRARR